MRTRTTIAIGLVILVALAGCNALDPGGNDGQFDSFDFPDGTGPDGISNATALLQTHQNVLAENSYRIAFNANYAQQYGGGNTTSVIASNATQERQLLDSVVQGREISQYLDGDRMYSETRFGNQTAYDTQQLSGSIDAIHRDSTLPGQLLETIVMSGSFTANRTETVGGHDTVVYRSRTPRANASGQIPDEIARYNATVQIDQDGRIRWAELFATGTTNGTQEIYYQEFRIRDVGDVTVSRPAWVDNATE